VTSILPLGKTQFFDAQGVPLAGGTVGFYIPSTLTLKTTWQDQAQSTPNTNPVLLDGAGEALIWGSGTYRQIVKDSLGNLIWDQLTQDSIPAGGVTNAGLAPAPTLTLKGNNTVSTGPILDLTVTQVNTMLGARIRPAAATYFVDPVLGTDDGAHGTGVGAAAWKTIQFAHNYLRGNIDLAGLTVTLQLANGTYHENILAAGPMVGGNAYVLRGDPVTPANVVIQGASNLTATMFLTDYAEIIFSGVTLKGGAGCIAVDQFAVADLSNVAFGDTGFAVAQVTVSKFGGITFTGPISIVGSGTALNFVNVSNLGFLDLAAQAINVPQATSYAGNPIFVVSQGSLLSSGGATTFTGVGAAITGKKYDINLNGVLSTSGTVYPGAIAGTTSTGGQASP
jgi:hypothetical protein